jgi:hypothetical protein
MYARVFDNPMLVKHLRSRLRPAPTVTGIVIALVLSGMLLWAGASRGDVGDVFPWMIALQCTILLLFGTSQVGSSAGAARDSGILEFHRASPLSPLDLALGFLLGAPIREYVMAACVTPFALFAAMSGSVGAIGYAILLGLLLTGSLLFHSIAMLGGLVAGKRGAVGILLVIVCYVFAPGAIEGRIGLPGTLTIVPACMELNAEGGPTVARARSDWPPRFFGLEVPVWIQSYAYQVPLFALVFVCCVRRMRAADRPVYSKTQGALAIAVLGLLAIASVVPTPGGSSASERPIVLHYVLATAGILMAVAVTPSRGEWANGIRRASRLGRRRPSPLHDWAANFVCLVIYAAVIVGLSFASLVATSMVPDDRSSWIRAVAVASLTVTYFGWGLQCGYLRFGRIGPIFFGLVLFFLWLVPLMAGGVLALQGLDNASRLIRDISPLTGIATGSGPALVSAVAATIAAGVLLWMAIARGEQRLRRQIAQHEVAKIV